MTATYTFDVFSSLDGFGAAGGDWTGYWGKQGPELLEHRLALYSEAQRMVFGANTYRAFVAMLASNAEGSEEHDPWVTRMRDLPATVVSTTLEGPLDWPHASLVRGDAVDVVARLKQESGVPLRSHGSLAMNRSLMAAGLVDRVQVTLFPVITGQTGLDPIFQGAADFDLELIESRTLDGHIQELIYRPTRLRQRHALRVRTGLLRVAGRHRRRKGPPSDGVVEIGCAVSPSRQRRGIATAVVARLWSRVGARASRPCARHAAH
jgi:dihydrofolate reductase